MKKTIILISILIINIWAKDTKEIPDVCQAFLDPDERAKMLLPFKYGDVPINIDINNNGVDENVSYATPGKRYPRYNLDVFNKNKPNRSINLKYINDDYYEKIRWSGYEKILFFEGKYYIVDYYDTDTKKPIYISYINSKNIITPVCKLKNKISYKVVRHDNEYSDELCQSLPEYIVKNEVIAFNIASKLEANSKEKRYCGSHNYVIGSIAYFDYNNDGKKEYLQMLEHQYDSSKHTYGLINESKTKLQKVSDDDDCIHGTRKWFYHDGKTYYFKGHKIDTKYEIGIYKNNKHKTVCWYEAETTTSVDTNTSTKIKKDK